MSDTTSASFCSVSCKSKGGQYIEIKQGTQIYQTELYKYSFSVFFKIKDRSTVTSYNKKHWYITCWSEHHHHTNNARKQRTQQNTTPLQPGRETKRNHPRTVSSTPMLRHAKYSGTLQSWAAAWTPPPRDYHPQATHTRSSIPRLQWWCFSRTLPSQCWWKTLILTTLRGGLASPTTSHLCQGLRYLNLL